MSHTPGPWKTTIRKAGAFDVFAGEYPELSYPICSRGSSVEHMEAECAANAALIAAAPDLLAALYNMLDDGDETDRAQARAAIEKATSHE